MAILISWLWGLGICLHSLVNLLRWRFSPQEKRSRDHEGQPGSQRRPTVTQPGHLGFHNGRGRAFGSPLLAQPVWNDMASGSAQTPGGIIPKIRGPGSQGLEQGGYKAFPTPTRRSHTSQPALHISLRSHAHLVSKSSHYDQTIFPSLRSACRWGMTSCPDGVT